MAAFSINIDLILLYPKAEFDLTKTAGYLENYLFKELKIKASELEVPFFDPNCTRFVFAFANIIFIDSVFQM